MPLIGQHNYSEAMTRLDQMPRLVEDVEATGLSPWLDDVIVGYALAAPTLGEDVYYFPVRHAEGNNLTEEQHDQIKQLLSKPDVTYTGWNIKYDIEMGAKEGIPVPQLAEDCMLAAHLLNENELNFKLKDLATKYVDPDAAAAEIELLDLLNQHGAGKAGMWMLDPKLVTRYATDDDRLTEKMRHLQLQGLRDWGLASIWQEVNDYMLATVRMEQRGLRLDLPLVQQKFDDCEAMIERSYRRLADLAGYEINPNSHPQMVAFTGLPSTRKEYLEEIRSGNPAIDAVIEYRAWAKAKTSYYGPYLKYVDADGILHPNFKLHGTVAGRPSATDPNLLAVPRYNEIFSVKDVFIARPGFVLVSCDYSQAELRMGSFFAREREMMRILNGGGDIHGETAKILNIDRDTAKRINFGVFYGIGKRKLSRTLRITESEADEYLDIYHGRFRGIRPLYRGMQMLAQYHGYIRLWTGRVRRYNVEYSEPHKALSNRVQGGVAELMRHAILRLDKMVQQGAFHMLLQVYDQILLEVPIDGRTNDTIALIKSTMEDDLGIFTECPPKVDVMVGKRWSQLKKWTPETPYIPSKKRAA